MRLHCILVRRMDAKVSDAEIERLLAHSAWLSDLARRLVRDPAAADDLVQDTWHAALRSSRAGERMGRGWLATVIANLARARTRGEHARREREQRCASSENVDGPDELVLRAESQRNLLSHVLSLDEPYRGSLLARYVEGLSAAEIARRTGTNESTVRTRISRALEELRSRLASEHGSDPTHGLGIFLANPGGNGMSVVATTASAGIGAWIMGTTTKVALAAALVIGAWFAWKEWESKESPPEVAAAASTQQAVPKPALAEATPLKSIDRVVVEKEVTPLASQTVETKAAATPPQLETSLVFHARAVDAVTHTAVAGAKLKLRAGTLAANPALNPESDSDGRFSVHAEDWNKVALTLDADGYSRVWVMPSANHETPETAFEVVLARAVTVRVHILRQSGAPIEGAAFTVKFARYQLMQPDDPGVTNLALLDYDVLSAKTDATGTAVLANLPARAGLKLSASLLRATLRTESKALVLQPGEVRDLIWRTGSGCRIFGSVKATDGKPVLGQEIWLEPMGGRVHGARFFEPYNDEGRRSAHCDGTGVFEFTDVPAGLWFVGPAEVRGQNAEWKDGLVAAWAQNVEVRAEDSELRVDIALARDLTIRGRVEDPDGRPVASMLIRGQHTQNGAETMTYSGTEGSFVLGPLVPGSYRLTADPRGSVGKTVFMASGELIAADGARDIVLRVRLGSSLTGRVVDDLTGKPVSANLMLAPVAEEERIGFTLQTAASDGEHEFIFQSLPPATYSICASTTSGSIGFLKVITLAAGEQRTDVEIRVTLGAKVNIFYDAANPYGGVQLRFDGQVIAADGMEKGTRRSFSVPAGHSIARMILYPDTTAFDTDFTLNAGETKELRFDGAWK